MSGSVIDINIDFNNIIADRSVIGHGIGFCLGYAVDSDIGANRKITLDETVKQWNIKILRWPGGTISQYLLWNTMDERGVFHDPPRPRVVARDLNPANAHYKPTDADGFFTRPIMGLDEFIDLTVKKNDIMPIICLPFMGDMYPGSVINYEDFMKTVAAQVQYIVDRGITGIYYEIGNEVEDHQLVRHISSDHAECAAFFNGRYDTIYQIIKEIDPAAKIGPGLLLVAQPAWIQMTTLILDHVKDKMQMLPPHQYGNALSGGAKGPPSDYNTYRGFERDAANRMRPVRAAMAAFGEKYAGMEFIVMEYNHRINNGGRYTDVGGVMYKTLFMMDIIGDMLSLPHTSYIAQWCSRSNFNNTPDTVDINRDDAHALYPDGTPTLAGMPTLIASSHFKDQTAASVSSSRSVNAYASRDSKTGAQAVIIVNKDDAAHKVNINMEGGLETDSADNVRTFVFTGANGLPADRDFSYKPVDSVTISGGKISTSLPPVSITVIDIGSQNPPPPAVTSTASDNRTVVTNITNIK